MIKAPLSPAGSALVVVLWTMAVLSILAASVTSAVSLELRVVKNFTDELKASNLAQAGVAVAMAQLAADELDFDSHEDLWYEDERTFARVELGDGEYSVTRPSTDGYEDIAYGMVDEESKLNINTATRDMLLELPDMTVEIADALLDWRDEDGAPEAYGAETSYYLSLDDPYFSKDEPFSTLQETLLLRGMTREDLFGEDANDNGRLDWAENDGHQRPPADDADGRLQRGLAQYLTVYSFAWNQDAYGQQRINVTSASEAELAALEGIDEEQAKAIVEFRKENKFSNIGQLLDVTKPKQEEKKQPAGTRGPPGRSRRSVSGRSSRTLSSRGPSAGNPRASSDKGNNGGNPKPANPNSGSSPRPRTGPSSGQKQAPPGTDEKVIELDTLKQIADQITVVDEERLPGRINVNTAPEAVLLAVPGFTLDIVQALWDQREDTPLQNLGELLDVDGITADVFKQCCNFLCVRSVHFRIRSLGQVTNSRVQRRVDCVVERSLDEVKIVYWREDAGR